MSKRKSIEAKVLKVMKDTDISGKNYELYKKFFAGMSDKDFDMWMTDLKDGKFYVSIVIPTNNEDMVDVTRNIKVAKSIGLDLFQHIDMVSPDGTVYRSPFKMLLYPLNIRRASQHLTKGISVAEHSRSRSTLTNQVTNASRSAKITFPEAQVLNGKNMPATLGELFSSRGGDRGSLNAMNAYIFKYGKVEQANLERFTKQSGSTKTVKAIFKAMHIDITI